MSNKYFTTDFHRHEGRPDGCGCGSRPPVTDPDCQPQITIPDCQPNCGCQVEPDCGCQVEPDCNCQTGSNCDCGCTSQPDCDCNTQSDTEDTGACCKESMLSALRMLFRKPLSRYLDYNQIAVLTDGAVLGGYLTQPDDSYATYDNLSEMLTGTLGRVTSTTCDLLDVKGPVYTTTAIPENTTVLSSALTYLVNNTIANVDVSASTELADFIMALRGLSPQLTPTSGLVGQLQTGLENYIQVLGDEVSKVSTCAVKALAIGVAPGTSAAEAAQNYQNAKQALLWMLGNGNFPHYPGHGPCFPCQPPCPGPGPRPPRPPRPWYEVEADEDCKPRCRWVCDEECDPCSCTAGVIDRLVGEDGSNSGVSLTAGNLILSNVDVLGNVNNVLVLANDDAERFYFVCAQEVGFMD